MTDLARETGGAVALGAFDGDAMTYVEAIHGSSALYPVSYTHLDVYKRQGQQAREARAAWGP